MDIKRVLIVGSISIKLTVSPWALLWVKNFKEFGFEVKLFDQRAAVRAFGLNFKEIFPKIHELFVKIMNKKLLNLVKKWRPDMAFFIKGDLVFPSTILQIKKLGVTTILWSPDDPWLFYEISRNIATVYDYIITASEKCVPWYRHIGCKHVTYMPYTVSYTHLTLPTTERV